MSYPTLEDTLLEAQKDGLDQTRQLELVDFWASGAIEDSANQFGQEAWQDRQRFSSFVREKAGEAKNKLLESVTETKLSSHFGSDVEARNRFVTQLGEYQTDYSRYSEEFIPLAKSVVEAATFAKLPDQRSISGSVDDEKGNKLVEYATAFNSSGNGDYADVFINDKEKGIVGGDTISFPKKFNGAQYKLDALRKSLEETEAQLNNLSTMGPVLSSTQVVPQIAAYSIDQQEQHLLADADSKRKELAAFEEMISRNPYGANHEGSNLYISDQIKKKVGEGNPAYEQVGQGVLEGFWSSAKSVAKQIPPFLMSGIAAAPLGEEVPSAVANVAAFGPIFGTSQLLKTPFARDTLGKVTEPIEGVVASGQEAVAPTLEKVIDDASIYNQLVQQEETFSRLAVTDPKLAKDLNKVADATAQGVAVAAQFAIARTAAMPGVGLQAAGAKIQELNAKIKVLRAQGDNESADWIEENKYAVARRSGMWEMLVERISLGHDPTRALGNVGTYKQAIRELASSVGGEMFEGGMAQAAGAIDEFLTGITTEDEFIEAMQGIPEAALLEGIGVVIPSGARAAVAPILVNSHKRAARALQAARANTPPPLPRVPPPSPAQGVSAAPAATATTSPFTVVGAPTPAPYVSQPVNPQADLNRVAENQIQQQEAQDSVTEKVYGQPGDSPDVNVTAKRQVRPKRLPQTVKFLQAIETISRNATINSMIGTGKPDVAFTFTNNRQEQEFANEDIFYWTFDPANPPKHYEAGISRYLVSELQDNPEYKAATVAEKEKMMNEVLFDSYPLFEEMKRRGSVVGNIAGKTMLMTDEDLLKKIESGAVDPNKIFWYHDNTSGISVEAQQLKEIIPPERQALKEAKFGRKKKSGEYVQSKSVEQALLGNTKYGIPTVTIGGKVLYPETETSQLDDILDGESIQTETRDGTFLELTDEVFKFKRKARNGRYVTKASEENLIKALDAKFSKNNWILKLDAGAQRMGIIDPLRGGLTEDRKNFTADIPVMKDIFYIAQQRHDPNFEYRVGFKVAKDGTINLIPFGIHGGRSQPYESPFAVVTEEDGTTNPLQVNVQAQGWKPIGLPIVSQSLKTRIRDMLDNLQENLGDKLVPGTIYGADVIEDKGGIMKIAELNPLDSDGVSGALAYYGGAATGIGALARNGFTAESMAAYAGYMRAAGSDAVADKIMQIAIDRLGDTQGGEFQPIADDLYKQGMLFMPEHSRAVTEKLEIDLIKGIVKPNDFNRVQDVLEAIIETDQPINPELRAYAKRLYDNATISFSRGLDFPVHRNDGLGARFTLNDFSVFLSKNPDLYSTLHEISHALAYPKMDQRLSWTSTKFKNPNASRGDYFRALNEVLNDPNVDPRQKEIVSNYIMAVKELGYADHAFSDFVMLDSGIIDNAIGLLPYGLSSIDEFYAELTDHRFREKLASIPLEKAVQRNAIRRLINSIYEWIKSVLFKEGDKNKNLLDKSVADFMAFIAHDEYAMTNWEAYAVRRHNANTIPKTKEELIKKYNPTGNPNVIVKRVGKKVAVGRKAPQKPKELQFPDNKKPKVVKVQNKLLRDGVVVPDDGGSGEVITKALELPDGSFVDAKRFKPDSVVYVNPYSSYGVLTGKKVSTIVPMSEVMLPDGSTEFMPDQAIVFQSLKKGDTLNAPIGAREVKKIKNFYNAANEVASRRTYGMREETAGKNSYLFIWSNGNAKWNVSGKLEEGKTINLDANQILVQSGSLKEARQIADFLPRLPLYEASFEAGGMLKRIGASVSPNSEVYKELSKDFGEDLVKISESEVVRYVDRFMDEITKTKESGLSLNLPEESAPYKNRRVQKGFESETSDKIVPLFDIYEIEMPGTKFHQSTITVPHGSSHEDIVAHINKKYQSSGDALYGKPEKQSFAGRKISIDHLNERMLARLQELKELIRSKAPSDQIESEAATIQESAEYNEFLELKDVYPRAFPRDYKFQGIEHAANTLADWLIDNPEEADGFVDKEQQSKKRIALAKTFTELTDTLLERLDANDLTFFNEHDDKAKALVNQVLDYIISIENPENITDRQLTAINLALQNFLDSDGYNIRTFSKLATKMYSNKEVDRLDNVKSKLVNQGVSHPFGLPISDWRRNFIPGVASKTGISIADFTAETLAIFNRQETREAFASILSPFINGINAFKRMRHEFRREFNDKINKQGATTRLEDHRIGAALFVTQFQQNSTSPKGIASPEIQLLNRIESLEKSIQRKEQSSRRRDKEEAAIDREAFSQVIEPFAGALQAGLINYDDFIDSVERALTPKEFNLMEIAREPGRRYFSRLDSINMMARNEPLQDWKNYFKQVQYDLTGDKMTNSWGEKAMKTPDSILQPREGLGKDSVYSLNWRPAFEWQLDEVAYELNTGIERVMLFDFLNDSRFDQILDGDETDKGRASRIRNQVGAVHANIKNREIRVGTLAGAALEGTKLIIANKLVSLKAVANQLIPFINFGLNHPVTLSTVTYNALTDKGRRKQIQDFVNDVPDLKNRIQQWDTLIDSFQVSQRFKKSGMKTGASSVTETGMVALAKFADVTRTVISSPYGFGLPVTLTNGLSEVFAAKNVFMSLYLKALVEKGTLKNAEEWFSNPVKDPDALALAQLEFDSFVLSPVSSEFRSEFAQRNSFGKIAANLLLTGLLRTASQQSIRSVTSLRDFGIAFWDYASYPNQANLKHFADTAREVEKQFFNIAIYYGIASLAHAGLGSIFTASSYVIEAALSGDKEEKDKWMRRLRVLERLNREGALDFMRAQLNTDILFAMAPMPALFQSNPAREAFSSIFKAEALHDGSIESIEEELEMMRKKRDDIKKILQIARLTGAMTEPEYNRHSISLEYAEYAVANLEVERDNKKNFASSVWANTVKSMTPLPSEHDMARYSTSYIPDEVKEVLLSQTERAKKSEDLMEKARAGYGYWQIGAYLNLSGPSHKAARTVLKEWSSEKVEKEENEKKRLQQILELAK